MAAEQQAEQQGTDEVGPARGDGKRRLWLGPAVTALAVVVVVATVSYLADDPSAGQPPLLRLAGGAGAELAADVAMSSSAGPAYVLDGSLPEGTPDPAPVYEFVPGRADESTVSQLVQALGLTTAPTRLEGGWLVTDAAGQLHVADDGGQSWSFMSPALGSMECPPEVAADATESSEGGSMVCASAGFAPPESSGPDGTVVYGGSYSPLGDQRTPSEDMVRQTASPVLEAAGVDAEVMRLTSMPGMATAVVERHVAGLPAFGLETGVTVLPDGTVANGYGYLGSTQPRDNYPLVSATAAFEQLVAQSGLPPIVEDAPLTGAEPATLAPAPSPVPTSLPGDTPVEQPIDPPTPRCVAADCRRPASPVAPAVPGPAVPEPPVAPPSDATPAPPPEPQRVTGAEPGLMVTWEVDEQLLVPAWLLTIEGDWVLPVVAVDPAFLADPEEPVPGPGGGWQPYPPRTPEPLPAPGEPQPGLYPGISFTDATLGRDGRTLTVTVTGPPQGDGSCEATYAIDAKADAEQVTVAVTMTPNDQGAEIACILIAEVIPLTVTLDEPLADRAVVDAATGAEVPVQGR